MSTVRRVCVVSGARADAGLLHWPMRAIAATRGLSLQLVVTGQHLSAAHGYTVRDFEGAGFPVDARVEMLLSADSRSGVAKSVGLGTIGFADALSRLRPDVVLVLGDRFEIFAAAQSAMLLGIPLVHIAGGDVTEGAVDETLRHCITKMSDLHLVTSAQAARRVRQLGEDPERVHIVGSPGIDYLLKTKLLARCELEEQIGFRFRDRNLLVTFHPVTRGSSSSASQLDALLAALDELDDKIGLLITAPNSDADGTLLARELCNFAAARERATYCVNLGSLRYWSAMREVDALVGNSSSALYEAPSLKKPAVDIGDRQRGRLRPDSVVHAAPDRDAIADAIRRALELDCSRVVNPYGDGHSAERIARVLVKTDLTPKPKRFFDLP